MFYWPVLLSIVMVCMTDYKCVRQHVTDTRQHTRTQSRHISFPQCRIIKQVMQYDVKYRDWNRCQLE